MNIDFSRTCEERTPARGELHNLIAQRFGGATQIHILKAEQVQRSYVQRLSLDIDGTIRTLVVKRFSRERSRIERLMITRWLAKMNLTHIAPVLLGVVPAQSAPFVWHVYEDLGDSALDQEKATAGFMPAKDRGFLSPLQTGPDRSRTAAIVHRVAELHEAFMKHALLAECRKECVELGDQYLESNVHDAICAIESLQGSTIIRSSAQKKMLAGLMCKLGNLQADLPWRKELLDQLGGPDTLLHGDLGVKNAFVLHTPHGLDARLIDWDHTGVGPVSYDLSTFLMQLPPDDRLWALDAYKSHRTRAPSHWPSNEEWNLLFETHEYARLANCIIWPAKAAVDGEVDWTVEELSKIRNWFDRLSPVLPDRQEGTFNETLLHHQR